MKETEMTCFWCGKPIGFFHTTVVVWGIPHKLHSTWFKDCVVEYKEWHDQIYQAPGDIRNPTR